MEKVRAGESLLPLLPEALAAQRSGDFSSLDIADRLLKHLKRHTQELKFPHHREFILGLTLPALACSRLEPRTSAMVSLRQLIVQVGIYHPELLLHLALPEVLDALRERLGDPGTDLDCQGRPLASSGKTKIAELALESLETLPDSLPARFRGTLTALIRVDAWMSQGFLGKKLASHLIKVLSELLQGEKPLPDEDFLWDLLELVNSSQIRQLPPEDLMGFLRWLPRRQSYWGPMLRLIASGRNPTWNDQLWALMAGEEMHRSQREAAVRQALAQGLLSQHQLPVD